MTCPHRQSHVWRDVTVLVVIVLGFLVLREGLGWLFKTNHVHSAVGETRTLVREVVDMLHRNGFR